MSAKGDLVAKQKRLRALQANPDDRHHGTNTGYTYGCRCSRCRYAKHTAADKARMAAQQREQLARLEADLLVRRPYVDPFAFDEHRDAWETLPADDSFAFFLATVGPNQFSKDEMWMYVQMKTALMEGVAA